jgi:quercetin dioxygenase-like cupin family protein
MADQLTERRQLPPTAYQKWLVEEGINVFEGLMVPDVLDVPRTRWPRLDGLGAYIQTPGTVAGEIGMYVLEIPPGGVLKPERHMYEETLLVIQGVGSIEVWTTDKAKVQRAEWAKGSLFTPPMNAWHRLINGSSEPAVILGVTNAPEIIDLYHNLEFVYNCDFVFRDRFSPDDRYFASTLERHVTSAGRTTLASSMIPDIWNAELVSTERKSRGGLHIALQLGGNPLCGHIAEWPVGIYHKAHAHNAGAVLVGLTGKGYFSMWPGDLGVHPYKDGHGDEVFEADWGPRSIYSPPDGWFHQHFNTGPTPARHLAFHWASRWFPRSRDIHRNAIMTSVSNGGSLIEYEEEDPEIRRRFEARLKKSGVKCAMPSIEDLAAAK